MPTKAFILKKFFKNFLFTLILISFFVGIIYLRKQKKIPVEAVGVPVINVNFGKQIQTGSPLLFGGAHAPPNDDKEAWDKLASSGITSIRRDLFLEYAVPANMSLDEYKQNKNNIQNTDKWNTNFIIETKTLFENAKKRNMKTIGIISYSPAWLNYNGKLKGVPKDWNIYEDLVKKMYTLLRSNIDYLEVWNEADWKSFLDTTGSNMTREQAYLEIYRHASKAVRDVDTLANDGKITPLGGPALADPRQNQFVSILLADSQTKNLVNFISYHAYGNNDAYRSGIVERLQQYGRADLPMYISEWNKNGDPKLENDYTFTAKGITFTADRLISYFKDGIKMASYFATIKNVPGDKEAAIDGYGVYRIVNNKHVYFPVLKTFQMMSRTLGLGLGDSKIYDAQDVNGLTTLGFQNSNNQYGVIVVNPDIQQKITINASGIPFGKVLVAVYNASDAADPSIEICSDVLTTKKNNLSFQVDAPGSGNLGITFTNPSLSLSTVLNVLGITTTSSCLNSLN